MLPIISSFSYKTDINLKFIPTDSDVCCWPVTEAWNIILTTCNLRGRIKMEDDQFEMASSRLRLINMQWTVVAQQNTVRTPQQHTIVGIKQAEKDHAKSTCANNANKLKRLSVWHLMSYARRIPVQTWQNILC